MKKVTAAALFCFLMVATALPQITHSVTLNWTASVTTGVTGYNVYRFSGACAPTTVFTRLTATPIAPVTYTDSAVTSGAIYCYTVTAVAPGGESVGAGTWQVTIPIFTASAIPVPPTGLSGTAQ